MMTCKCDLCDSQTVSPMSSANNTPVLPHDVLCTLMGFLDIRTLKAASLVNRDLTDRGDRLIAVIPHLRQIGKKQDVATR
ncbi:hypothetical protein BS47DRAFT_1335127 [Hydnum rufescens UP504]|uniref:F-box domain-containing protein n=1 Tax=Hydnum rufescens UP504 TaxID=1448309 RepID=A0A9P6E2S0_9AGAM|nr:hypothetical protein BS47DRAFT_1335127 [Hydnum rufescens UP504]